MGSQMKSWMKTQMVKGFRFLGILAIVSGIVYAGLLFAMPGIQGATAFGSQLFLGMLGFQARNLGNLVFFNDEKAEIIPLCTGALELAILVGAIIASEDRDLVSRILGVFYAVVSLYVVNIVRVGFTLASAVWFGWGFAEVVHSLLFRAFLVFAILGLYGAWYLGIARLRGRCFRDTHAFPF